MAHLITICRLCSTTEQIFDVFHPHLDNGEQLRFSILLATGIQIKQTDLISKMVCHRCCEIVLKLHKYRTNAVANDKLLKERANQPYTPPIIDQDGLLRTASEMLHNSKSLYDSLELLKFPIKKEIIDQPADQLPENGTSSKPSVDSTHAGVDVHVLADPLLSSIPSMATDSSSVAENNTVLSEGVCTGVSSATMNAAQQLPNGTQTVDNSVVSLRQYRSVPKVKYKHPSVKNALEIYKNIVLPEKVFRFDISPVISLDSAEVSDWYTEQLRALEQKLPNISFKKVPNVDGNVPIVSNDALSALTSAEHSAITLSKHSAISSCKSNIRTLCSKKYKAKRSPRRIVESSDNDKTVSSEEYQPLKSDVKENDILKINPMTVEAPLTNQQETIPSINANSNDEDTKKSNERCAQIKRKSVFLQNDDAVPEKKKLIENNKNALSTRTKVDSSQNCFSDKKESSVELIQQDVTSNIIADTFLCRKCNKLYDTESELLNHERTHRRCKFCNKKMKSMEMLNKHQNETCSVNIINNQPSIELKKVDSIPHLVKKYAKAFQKPAAEKQTAPTVNFTSNEYIDYSELGLSIEKAPSPVSANELFMELEESIVNQYFTLLEDFEKNNYNSGDKLINENSQNSEVICISDGSDNETEEMSANTTVSSPAHQDNQLQPKINLKLGFQSNLNENEIIRSMFKKHYSNFSKTCENGTQTLLLSNSNVTPISTNSNMKLNNMFTELFSYKIPVLLKSQPNVSVECKSILTSETPVLNYGWAPKKAICLETNDTQEQQLTHKKTVVPNRLPTNPMLNSPPNYYESIMFNRQSSNGAYTTEKCTGGKYTVPPPPPPSIHNFNNVFPGTLPRTPYNNVVHQRQPITFKQSVAMPNTPTAAIPSSNYQMPIAPANKTSVALENNQGHVFYDQPEQLFYNNQNVNVNNYFMFSNDTHPIQQETSTVNNGISYLNNANTGSLPSYEKHLQRYNVGTANQNRNIVPSETHIQITQNTTGMLRVKHFHELS